MKTPRSETTQLFLSQRLYKTQYTRKDILFNGLTSLVLFVSYFAGVGRNNSLTLSLSLFSSFFEIFLIRCYARCDDKRGLRVNLGGNVVLQNPVELKFRLREYSSVVRMKLGFVGFVDAPHCATALRISGFFNIAGNLNSSSLSLSLCSLSPIILFLSFFYNISRRAPSPTVLIYSGIFAITAVRNFIMERVPIWIYATLHFSRRPTYDFFSLYSARVRIEIICPVEIPRLMLITDPSLSVWLAGNILKQSKEKTAPIFMQRRFNRDILSVIQAKKFKRAKSTIYREEKLHAEEEEE